MTLVTDAHLYQNKFSCFFDMVKLLESNHGCSINSTQIRKLPALSRSKRHILSTDGNPRCIAVVEVGVGEKIFFILEVDTSDAVKPLSTQILVLKQPKVWGQDRKLLERELMGGSLRWPVKTLDILCGNLGYKGISHPRSGSTNKGVLDSGSIEGWADRFYFWMNSN